MINIDVLVARQPIYDSKLKVFAYELLYRRDGEIEMYTGEEPEAASISVIMETFLNIGIETMTNKKPGFINFTENLLTSDFIKMLPVEYLGIEILETVEPSGKILDVCGELKALGYTIALDDYCYNRSTEKFIPYADIIKMDFLQSGDEELRSIVSKCGRNGVKFVAEKIETKEDFKKAKSFGYDYFQGNYFKKPSLVQSKDLLPFQISTLRVLEILHNEVCDIGDIASVIGGDPGMAYKLFKLANSVMYGGRYKTSDVVSAITRIGLKDLRTWILYIMLYGANKDKPDELTKQSMLRAIAAEEICRTKGLGYDISGFSLMGLFSLMDTIMDASFDVILSHIHLPEYITAALTNPGDDIYGAAIRVIRAYDEADWEEARRAGALIGLPVEEYQKIYRKAVERCDRTYDALG